MSLWFEFVFIFFCDSFFHSNCDEPVCETGLVRFSLQVFKTYYFQSINIHHWIFSSFQFQFFNLNVLAPDGGWATRASTVDRAKSHLEHRHRLSVGFAGEVQPGPSRGQPVQRGKRRLPLEPRGQHPCDNPTAPFPFSLLWPVWMNTAGNYLEVSNFFWLATSFNFDWQLSAVVGRTQNDLFQLKLCIPSIIFLPARWILCLYYSLTRDVSKMLSSDLWQKKNLLCSI